MIIYMNWEEGDDIEIDDQKFESIIRPNDIRNYLFHLTYCM